MRLCDFLTNETFEYPRKRIFRIPSEQSKRKREEDVLQSCKRAHDARGAGLRQHDDDEQARAPMAAQGGERCFARDAQDADQAQCQDARQPGGAFRACLLALEQWFLLVARAVTDNGNAESACSPACSRSLVLLPMPCPFVLTVPSAGCSLRMF